MTARPRSDAPTLRRASRTKRRCLRAHKLSVYPNTHTHKCDTSIATPCKSPNSARGQQAVFDPKGRLPISCNWGDGLEPSPFGHWEYCAPSAHIVMVGPRHLNTHKIGTIHSPTCWEPRTKRGVPTTLLEALEIDINSRHKIEVLARQLPCETSSAPNHNENEHQHDTMRGKVLRNQAAVSNMYISEVAPEERINGLNLFGLGARTQPTRGGTWVLSPEAATSRTLNREVCAWEHHFPAEHTRTHGQIRTQTRTQSRILTQLQTQTQTQTQADRPTNRRMDGQTPRVISILCGTCTRMVSLTSAVVDT